METGDHAHVHRHIQVNPGGKVQPPYGPPEPKPDRLTEALENLAKAVVALDRKAHPDELIGPASQQAMQLIAMLTNARVSATPEQLGRLRGYVKGIDGSEAMTDHIDAIRRIMGWPEGATDSGSPEA